MDYSIVIPAKNEAPSLTTLIPRIQSVCPQAEIIISDDGSTDETAALCEQFGVTRVYSPYSMGNGAAIKRGARAATKDVVVFMDADGQHDPACIPLLLDKLEQGYDMVVGARDWSGQSGVGRGVANTFYNWLASVMTGNRIPDLTSGFRVARRSRFLEFLYLLPNGFSYPTTSTMAFFRNAYPVGFVPIEVARRVGKSHIRPIRDGVRFLLIIFKIATLYSPLKFFLPLAVVHVALGLMRYAYTYVATHSFTNMSALLISMGVLIFLMGLVSEQITALSYKGSGAVRSRSD